MIVVIFVVLLFLGSVAERRARSRVASARSAEVRDMGEVTANILEAEKRALAESQAKLQSDFEFREATFNADLEALR